MVKILFVCHGNICRSTAAETIFANMLHERGLTGFVILDSAGVSDEEEGNPMYPPMRRELVSRGIPILPHYARQITLDDFFAFDYILYMDASNLRYLSSYPKGKAKVLPITDFGKGFKEIEDPWYSGRYRLVVDQISSCLEGFCAFLEDSGVFR